MRRILMKASGRKIGQVEEKAGDTIMSGTLKPRQPADQLGDKAQEKPVSMRGMAGATVGSSLDRLKQFASKRPYATATTIVAVVGIAFLKALRGIKEG